jgi:hypothetical protein
MSIALCVGACAASVAVAQQPPGGGFEAAFVRQPKPARLLLADGREIAAKIGPDGTFPGTIGGRKGALAVESLRSAYYVVAAGVISSDGDKEQLLDKGLRAFEKGFDFAGPDGSFPDERGGATKKQNSLHPKSEFISAAARSLLLLQQVDLPPRFRARVAALLPRLQQSARWLASTPDLEEFFGRAKNTNQMLFVATALQESGVATADPSLTQRAQGLVERILARQTPDGTFPENGGFDSGYQTVSLDLLARYVVTLPNGPWRERVMAALRRGTDRFVQAVDATGAIDGSANTRTVACGPERAGSEPKGKAIDKFPLRLYYLGYLLNEQAKLEPVADRIHANGQGFTHFEKCEGGKRQK